MGSVLWLTGHWMKNPPTMLGALAWVRCGEPARTMFGRGHVTMVSPSLSIHDDGTIWGRNHDGVRKGPFDTVVLHHIMRERFVGFVAGARAAGQRVLLDVDDWFEGLPAFNPASLGTHKKANEKENREWLREVAKTCDGLIVSTPFLAEKLARVNDNVHLVRNTIEVSRFAEVADHNIATSAEAGRQPNLLWVGAAKWRLGDIQTLKGVLAPFARKHQLRVYHGGHSDGQLLPHEVWGFGPDDQDLCWGRPICQYDLYPTLLRDGHVGLVPLVDIPFNQAKSALKGMEYAAAGVPFIAYPTAEYRWLHETFGIGRLARKPKDWLRHLEELLDPEVRVAEALAGVEAAARFDRVTAAPEWEKALFG